MRIEAVVADAFGPFRGDRLSLVPGFNVIHGPNESGKSSWHAALYAGLCGMRRSRGKPRPADAAFTDRHRPWGGRNWKVTLRLQLDDGRVIEIEQGLGSGARSFVTDLQTGSSFAVDLDNEGSPDALTLVGLGRQTAAATVFVRQADVLQVLTGAGELQQAIERAAASSAADTTLDEAVDRVVAYRKDRIGLLRANATGPLKRAERRLDQAMHDLEAAEERYDAYHADAAGLRERQDSLEDVDANYAGVAAHEAERQRRSRWRAVRSAEQRLHQARVLMAEQPENDLEAPDHDAVNGALAAVGSYENLSETPPPLAGSTLEEIEAELERLPALPRGDLEPHESVVDAREDWLATVERRDEHATHEPAATIDSGPGDLDLDALADDLDALPPAQGAVSTPAGSSTAARLAAVAALVIGVLLSLGGLLPIGVPVAIVGGMLLYRSSRRGAKPTGGPAVDRDAGARARVLAILRSYGLPADVGELRRRAQAQRATSTAHDARAHWEARRRELDARVSAAADTLREAFAERGTLVAAVDDLASAYRQYQADCRARTDLARSAGRRADLEARLEDRAAAEAAHRRYNDQVRKVGRNLRAAAEAVGIEADDLDEMAAALTEWVIAEQERAEQWVEGERHDARLDEILKGWTIEELEAEIDAMKSEISGDPPTDDRDLPDRSAELAQLAVRRDSLRQHGAEQTGGLEANERALPSLAEAIEEEARARREFERLQRLDRALELTVELLQGARDKVHADIAPVLNETLRPWVPRVTDGRYDDVRVDPRTLSITVREPAGEYRPAVVLSHGTTEQLFLLLRLALARHLTTNEETAPLVLDDITVQSDRHRTISMLELLHELSADQQVILFSQEDEVVEWAQANLAGPRDSLTALSRMATA